LKDGEMNSAFGREDIELWVTKLKISKIDYDFSKFVSRYGSLN
jgi:hypothetical protein